MQSTSAKHQMVLRGWDKKSLWAVLLKAVSSSLLLNGLSLVPTIGAVQATEMAEVAKMTVSCQELHR